MNGKKGVLKSYYSKFITPREKEFLNNEAYLTKYNLIMTNFFINNISIKDLYDDILIDIIKDPKIARLKSVDITPWCCAILIDYNKKRAAP